MIDPTNSSLSPASGAVSRTAKAPAAASGRSFAAVQAAASAKLETAAAGVAAGDPDLEVWKPVGKRADYVQIVAGPRAGSYLNVSGNARHGKTFEIVQRDGKTFHVYGSGPGATEVEVPAKPSAGQRRPPAGESWGPVSGRSNYADVLSGPRNGLYVNLSGNPRDGQVFEIIKRGGKTFHVYGEGRSRLEVPVRS